MSRILSLLCTIILFFQGCELYDHTNPFDPENPSNKNNGANARFSIIDYALENDLPGIFNGDKVLSIMITNDGGGSTDGEIIGMLSTKDSLVSFLVPNYNKGYFFHKESGSKYPLTIYPGDILISGYRIHFSTNIQLPYDIAFVIYLNDSFNNTFVDSIVVNVR